MPREPKAWYNERSGWWSVDLARKRRRLVPGKPGDERLKAPTSEARDALAELLPECRVNLPAETGPDVQTVPGVIDEYLATACSANDVRTYADKKSLMNRFARRYRDQRSHRASGLFCVSRS